MTDVLALGLRSYRLMHPAAPNGALLLFLHGTGGTAAWAADEAHLSDFTAAGYAVAVPDALPPDPERPPKFLTNPQRWNDGSPTSPASTDDVGFLADVVADAVRRTKAHRVLAAGFSNGASMTFRLAAERSALFAGIAPVAGYCWTTAVPKRPMPTLFLIGTADPLVPPRGGDVALPWGNRIVRRPPIAGQLEAWARGLGCSPEPELLADEGGVQVERYPGPVAFHFVTVEGLGHHWPGGRGQLNARLGGPSASRANANRMLMQFWHDARLQ